MKKIIVVDDDSEVRAYLKQILRDSGYEVLEAENGCEAICIHDTHQSDLIITDIFMPVAEGLSTIVKLHQNYPETKIIAISGGGIMGIGNYLDHALMYGADAAIAKPFHRKQMIQTVNRLLDETLCHATAFCL